MVHYPGMDRLLFVLSISFGSIAAGYLVRRIARSRLPGADDVLRTVSRRLKLSAFFFLNPVALISTFWGIGALDPMVLGLPFLGILSVLVGMTGSMLAIRFLKIPPFRAGSVFTCGTFANILTMGGLVAYTLFREPGYALVQLFTMVMSPIYYLMGYPIAANIGNGRTPVFKIGSTTLKENPFLIFPLAAIAIGIGMRFTGIARPAFLASVVGFIVPTVAAVLGFAIGITLRFTGFRSYLREIAVIVAIRHLLLPAIMIPVAVLFGFVGVLDGLPFKILIIVSVMPVAFNALVPPAIYGFDLDLANSAWIVSTALLAIIVPALFLVFGIAL
jgi:predicted permease